MAKILFVEPFLGASHQQWALGWRKYSHHDIQIIGLSAHHWKWRMHGAAVTLAQQFLDMDFLPDWIVGSDMLDMASFLALSRPKSNGIKAALYFYENQLTYPWSDADEDRNNQRDNHYKFINYTSALVVDDCYFNSNYHQTSFLNALPDFLKQFPDYKNLETIHNIRQKSKVLPLGLDLAFFDSIKRDEAFNECPVILWNHRWEYDKNPAAFFNILFRLKALGLKFKLVVLGQEMSKSPPIFEKAKERLKTEILHWGYCDNRMDYAAYLWLADILPVTSNQDFFGGSIIEAVYCNTLPLLPQRLAYPEHFPTQHHFFYENDDVLFTKLVDLIKDWNSESIINTQNLVKHYDWRNLIETYDDSFRI